MPTPLPPPRLSMPGLILAALLCCGPARVCAAAPAPTPVASALPAAPAAMPTLATSATSATILPLLIGDNLDEQGKPKPLSALRLKLLADVQQELGMVFETHMYPWARAERYAIDGGGLILGLPRTAERLHALRYSDIAAHNNLWLVTRSDATFTYNGFADLRGKTIGAVRGYSYGEEFERARKSHLFHVDEDIASRGTRLARLMLRRVDAVLLVQPSSQGPREIEEDIRLYMATRQSAAGTSDSGGKGGARVGYSVLPNPVAIDSGVYFAIARGRDDGIIDRINAALQRIHQREEENKRENKREDKRESQRDGKRQRAPGDGPN